MIRLTGLTLAVLALLSLFAGYWVSARDRDVSPWQHIPDETADSFGWDSAWIEAGPFDLLSYRRFSEPGAALLTIYIEGDGLPWVTRTELSDDPTPRADRVLKLAVQDTVGNVAYLARPCFYLPADELASCPSDLWSLARYSEDVVAALDIALDRLKSDAGAAQLRLIGVSGGGVLAALLAARRDDVTSLITVTGNLDHAVWTARNGVTPMRDSLNAADVAQDIQHIPQVHFIGGDDTNVMVADVEAYMARMSDTGQSQVVVVPGQEHVCCWVQSWRALLGQAERLMAP
jgi:hypothetical protein